MPCIFYSDDASGQFTGSLSDVNWTKVYLNHYSNYLMLNFISTKTNDRAEKQQAVKELTICERKMNYAQNQKTFNKVFSERGIFDLKKMWKET